MICTRRRVSWLGMVAIMVGGVGAAPAHAADWSWHAVGAAYVAWTDNIFSSPDEPPEVVPPNTVLQPREDELYYQLTPGTLFTWESPQIIHELTLSLDATIYTIHDEAAAYTGRAGWRTLIAMSPRTELSASAGAAYGDLRTFATQTAAEAGQPAVQPASASFLSFEIGENVSHELTAETRLTHVGVARMVETTSDPAAEGVESTTSNSVELTGNVGADRSWRHDALSGVAGFSWLGLSVPAVNPEDPTDTSNRNDQINVSLAFAWRRDLTERVTTSLGAGITLITPIGGEVRGQPTVNGQIGYFPDWGGASVAVARSVTPNLYIAQNTVSDSATANLMLPVPILLDELREPTITLQGSGGVSRTQLVGTDGSLSSSSLVYLADAAISYRSSDALGITVRYQYIRQEADMNVVVPVFDYDRQTILISVAGRWPDRQAGEIPLRTSLRVDRSNLEAVGGQSGTRDAGPRSFSNP